MSGILNVLLSSFGGSSYVGYLAAISNPNATAVDNPRIALRSDQLNLSVDSFSSLGTQQLTALRLGLDGTISWQTALVDGLSYQRALGIDIDSAGNVVVAGTKYDTFNAYSTGYVAKFNSSGVVQWQRQINGRTVFNAVTVNAGDDIYCAGRGNLFTTSSSDIYVAKFNSAGTIQYRRNIGSTSVTSEYAYSIAVTNATYFVVTGAAEIGNLDGVFFLGEQATGASAGATSQKDAGGSGSQVGVVVRRGEADGIIYYAVNTYATLSFGSLLQSVLIRWSIGSGFVWQSQLSDPSNRDISIVDMCPDTTGAYFYGCGYSYPASGSPSQVQICKYVAATGELVWQRALSCSTVGLSANGIKVDSLDNIYVAIESASTSSLVLKMPGSGAGAGNSVVLEGNTYTYSATTFSVSMGALVSTAYSPTNSAFSETILTPISTSSANTLSIDEKPL